MGKPVYAIVLNWNNYSDTRECIESIRSSSHPIAQIVLVDNASRDGLIEQLQGDYAEDVIVHIIQNKANYGFARGVNVGIRYALARGAEFVFLLNNDAVIDRRCIQVLVSSLETNATAGIAGPRVFYHAEPDRIWHGSGYFSLIKTGVVNPEKNRLQTSSAGGIQGIQKASFLTGCAMLIRSQVFEKVGLFDEDFFFYGEDVDFCLRVTRAGFELLYVPQAKSWHKIGNVARDRTSPFVMYHLARSRLLVLRKNFSEAYLAYGLFVHLLLYTPYRMLQILQGSRSFSAAKAWIEGTWDGIIGGGPGYIPKASFLR
jgi:GT2 family glycosyltransferase